ncbi:integral membrane sensor hybrid histidine kinase [Methylobacterium sp. GXF4]|uniref:hybrid sensor histidine kinase/response regulator n=1 Tax=Methylobacterium sp. GXF4 TaxID=1096546 RepID=UPI000269A346|nr:hybrid sensor histidine kinase/response regulator [Methylobacterium sp. GXF4]EIZ83775.1 integral membrane sensor hybrid histidine kinase [Methylobacterium sp. GXF4]
MRLRTLLALIFAVGALLLTAAATTVVSQFVSARVQIRAEAHAAELAEHLRQIIDANMTERLGDMAVLSSVARTNATTPETRRAWVDALRQSYPAYAWIGFADQAGTVVASTGGMLEGESVAARPWFQQGIRAPTVIDIHEAKLLATRLPALLYGEPRRFVDVAVPLRDSTGAHVGVVGGHLSVTWMREMSRAAIATALKREPSVEVLILAGDGTVILGPGDQAGRRIEAELPTLPALTAGAELTSTRGTWPEGGDYFIGASRARPSVDRPTLPWTVLVRQPVEVAKAISSPIVNRLMLGGAAFTLLFALLGWWAAEYLAGPLRALAGAASTIGHDTAEAHLPKPRGYLEISELTGALTGLLARLGERDRALAQANCDLERRVSERTAELAQARDRAEAAQARAEAGERAKSDFLATMSHEVRTPLNAIVGFGDLLRDESSLTPHQKRCIDQMRVGCEVLTSVVNDILDYARIEADGVVLEAEPFSPRALVEETVALVAGTAERKGLDLRCEGDASDEPRVMGDKTRLRQVLLNLVNNAVKFTQHGSVTVVLTRTATAAGIDLRVSVRDTGIGIPVEAQARLFTRFVQADSSTTRRFGGTGLGLAIAKGLIEAMGGTIGLESRDGEGSTFWFSVTLPREPLGSQALDHVTGTAPPVSSASDTPRRAHLLLVEDGAINREIAQMVLEAMGYRISTACNGQEAVTMVREQAYDLVLMDVEMPVMDGMTAIRHIRDLEGTARHVPIIAMTAHVLPEQVQNLLAAGADGHVGKPFDRARLCAVIERSLGAVPLQERSAA